MDNLSRTGIDKILVVMSRYDFQVDSETLRLPTLKELVGFTTTLSNHVSTTEFTQSPTMKPIIDTTIAINELEDESEVRELKKNRVNNYDLFDGGKNLNDSDGTLLESKIEKEILDNDILSSEEIQRRSSSTSFINFEQRQNKGSSHDREKILKSDNEVKRVEVPVTMLDHTDVEEIAELVLLRVPESKFNSAILKPVFRVKILEQESDQVRNGSKKIEKVTKLENLPESSAENELPDIFRSTSGSHRKIDSSRFGEDPEPSIREHQRSKGRSHNRQRIVKARRRIRPFNSLSQDDGIIDVRNSESGHFQDQVVRRISRRRENTQKSALDTTTLVPEPLEKFSNTVRPTTLRGNHSVLSKVSNVTRGFYITRNIDEASTTSDPITTEYWNKLYDDSTHVDDLMTQEIEFTTQMIQSTTPEMEATIQIEETATPLEQTTYSTENESTIIQSTILIDSIQSFIVDQQLTTSLETVTPDYQSTIDDEITEFISSSDPTTQGNTINELEITTFRPRTTKKATTSDRMISIESTTTEFLVNSSKEIENNSMVTKPEETIKDVSEPLKTSENSYWRSLTIVEPNSTIVQSATVSTQYDEQFKAQTEIFEAENTTRFSKITSDQNNMLATTKVGKFEVETTTIPMQNTVHQLNGKIKLEAERSSQRTNNLNAKATVYKGGSNRGGVRYTTTAKSLAPIDGSLSKSRNKTQKLTSENLVSPINIIATKSYDLTVRSTENQEEIQIDTTSLPRSVTPPSRRRGNAKKPTRPLEITESTSSASIPRESLNTNFTVTNDYEHNIRTRVYNRPTYLTTNRDQSTVSHAENLRVSSKSRDNSLKTTISIENDKTRNYTPSHHVANSISSTEPYEKAVKSTTRGESTYLIMNFKEKIKSNLETAQPFSKVSNETQETSEFSNSPKNINVTSDPHGLYKIATGIIKAYDKTSVGKEILSTSKHYEISTANSSATPDPSSTMLLEDQQSTMKPSTLDDSTITSSESNEKTPEQTTLSVPTIYLTTNIVEPTGSDSLFSQTSDSGLEIMKFFVSENPDNNLKWINEASTKISATTNIYEETLKDELTTVTMDYSTMDSTKNNNGPFDESTTLEDESNTFLRTIDILDKITEPINSVDIGVTYEITTSEGKGTVSNSEGTSIPWLYVSGNKNIDERKTEIPVNMNDTTMEIMIEIPESTTASYASDDREKFITNFADVQTEMTTQTVSDISNGTTKEISLSTISNEEKSYVTTKPNNAKIILADSISEKSTYTTINIDTTSKQINLREKQLFSQNDVIPSGATSTTPIYEKSAYSTTEMSSTFQAPVIEPQIKRPRGRVRFTNFAGNSNDANEQNRRPVKQVVVRRRLAKDHQQNATTTKLNLIKSEIALNDKNKKTYRTQIKNVNGKYQNVEEQNKDTKNVETQQMSDESAKGDHIKIQNELNDQRPGEKTNSSKTTRRRVVIYRERPRPEKIVTTAKPVTTTTTATTTVQSSSSSDELADNKKRRRHKWRKRIVLKRSRVNVEEDDQSIAETGDFRRALIDGQYVKNSPDEITTSYIVMPDIVEKSSEHEDIAAEVNPFKSPGAFLRRPGTLVRNDALSRLRSKVSNTSLPTILPTSEVTPFVKIQFVDPTYEIKREDQSVRAQELAVTLSDPPAIDSSLTTGRVGLRTQGTTRKISTTVAPRMEPTSTLRTMPIVRRRQNGPRYNNNLRIVEAPVRPRRPAIIDYDYYVDDEIRLVLKPELKDKLFVTKKGAIRCLDQGNFAHPTSCKKFITCARMVNGQVIGTEYTCPDKLSFDPVGGICNWSAGLGCEEKPKSSN